MFNVGCITRDLFENLMEQKEVKSKDLDEKVYYATHLALKKFLHLNTREENLQR